MERPESIVDVVARIWPELFPGVEILDRDLWIDPVRRVPLVVGDRAGRVVLALPLQATDDAAALAVLDALAFLDKRIDVLARHLGAETAVTSSAVWVIAPRFDQEFLGRLRAMDTRSLRAFELVQLETWRGRRAYAVEVPLGEQAAASGRSSDEVAFFAQLPAEGRVLGELLLQRMDHVDERIDVLRGEHALEWRLQDELVCSAHIHGEAFDVHVPEGGDSGSIASREELDRALETVVRRYLVLLRARPLEPSRALSVLREPILTPEELAAFDPAT